MINYLAGPYTSETKKQHEYNIGRLFAFYSLLIWQGNSPIICPPLSSAGFDYSPIEEISCTSFLNECMSLISVCDIVFFTPGWEESAGCRAEYDKALQGDKKIKLIDGFNSESEIKLFKKHFQEISPYNLNALYGLEYLKSL